MIRPLTCPICQKPLPPQAATESKHFPFCSARCRQIDFFRWSEGKYAIVESLDRRMIEPREQSDDEGE